MSDAYEAFLADDMQMVRAKLAKVVLSSIETQGDATAIMATLVDRSPLYAEAISTSENLAAWAGSLAVLAGMLAELLPWVDTVEAGVAPDVTLLTVEDALRAVLRLS